MSRRCAPFNGDLQHRYQCVDIIDQIPSNITFDQAVTVSLCLATVVNGIWGHEDSSNSVRFTPPWEECSTTAYTGQAALILGGGTNVRQYGKYTSPPIPPVAPLSIIALTPHRRHHRPPPDTPQPPSARARKASL